MSDQSIQLLIYQLTGFYSIGLINARWVFSHNCFIGTTPRDKTIAIIYQEGALRACILPELKLKKSIIYARVYGRWRKVVDIIRFSRPYEIVELAEWRGIMRISSGLPGIPIIDCREGAAR